MSNDYYISEFDVGENDQELQDAYDEYLFTVWRDEIIEKQWLDEGNSKLQILRSEQDEHI